MNRNQGKFTTKKHFVKFLYSKYICQSFLFNLTIVSVSLSGSQRSSCMSNGLLTTIRKNVGNQGFWRIRSHGNVKRWVVMFEMSDASKDFVFVKADWHSGDQVHGKSFSEGCLEKYEHCGVTVKMYCNGLPSRENNVVVKCLWVQAYFLYQQYFLGLVVVHFYQI